MFSILGTLRKDRISLLIVMKQRFTAWIKTRFMAWMTISIPLILLTSIPHSRSGHCLAHIVESSSALSACYHSAVHKSETQLYIQCVKDVRIVWCTGEKVISLYIYMIWSKNGYISNLSVTMSRINQRIRTVELFKKGLSPDQFLPGSSSCSLPSSDSQ